MTLVQLLDAAYRSEYIDLDNLKKIEHFAKCWKNFLTLDIENIQLIEIPQYGINPITGKHVRLYAKTYKDLLKDEYRYLLDEERKE